MNSDIYIYIYISTYDMVISIGDIVSKNNIIIIRVINMI